MSTGAPPRIRRLHSTPRVDRIALAATPGEGPGGPRPIAASEVVALAGMVALALVAAVVAVAVAVHALLAGQAREVLGFRFPGVPATLDSAATIFAENLRVLGGVLAVLAVAQMLARSPDPGTRPMRWLLTLLRVLVGLVVTVNVLVVGGALGAYGARMARAMLPHGPVELAAYATALALTIAGRRHPLPVRAIAGWATVSVGLLAIAAILETWVNV